MKRIVLAGVLVLALSMLALPAFAVPTQNLASLANFYPEDTFMYFGFRTDAGFFDEVEALVTRIAAVTGDDASEFREGLDDLAQEISEDDAATFAATIQPLLGDTGAFGIINAEPMFDNNRSNDNESGYLLALSVTDRVGLQNLITNNDGFARNYEELEDNDDYAIYVPTDIINSSPTYVYFGNDVLLFSTDMALFPQAELSVPLSDNVNFTDTLNMLPAGDYAAAGFINPTTLFASFSEMMADEFGDVEVFGNMFTLYEENYHGIGVGFTVLDQDNLTMDVSLNADLEAVAESVGMTLPEYGVVDPAFAARVPAGAAAVFFYPDLAQAISQSAAQLGTLMDMQQQMMEEMGVDPDEFESAENQIAAMQFGIQMVLGGPLEEAFAWASGQSAFAAGIDFSAFPNGFESPPTRNPFGLSFVAENVDGGAQQLYDSLTSFLEGIDSSDSDIAISEKEIVNGEATNISIIVDDTPFPIEIQIAVTDSIFVIGTPGYVEAALTGDGSLSSRAAFQNATSVMLSDTPAYGYIALEPIIALISAGSRGRDARNMEALTLFESASFSGQILLPSTTSIRYVISLTPAE